MKLLESSRLTLPKMFFITDRKEIKSLPIGIPFFFGDPSIEEHIVRILEYEVLFASAMRSGYPFNFKRILEDNGYDDLMAFAYYHPAYMEYTTEGLLGDDYDVDIELTSLSSNMYQLKDYIKDSSCLVNVEKLKSLNVFPIWLDTIENAITTNIHNFATFNPNMYNKKLDGIYGGLELTAPNRNLLIIDISSSIPKQVSSTCLTLCKNLAETFYADIMITGSKTILFPYEELHLLNINTIYAIGMNNDAIYYRNLLFSDVKNYETVIGFGDNDSPLGSWGHTKSMSREDMHKQSKWTAKKLISFHCQNDKQLASYLEGFACSNVEHIQNWVQYIK